MTREKAIEIIENRFDIMGYQESTSLGEALDIAIEALEDVPDKKVGKWIEPLQDDGMSEPIFYQVRCSNCGFDLDLQTFCEELQRYGADKFCPNCGAEMEIMNE